MPAMQTNILTNFSSQFIIDPTLAIMLAVSRGSVMANYKEELSWDNVTDNSCPDIAKDAFAELAIAMDAFEEIFQKAAPKGKKAVFNYRHGNNGLSVGVALATDKSRNGSGFNWLPAK